MGLRPYFIGIITGCLLVGCASFTYPYFALDAQRYEGYLRGPTPKDDLPLTICQPTEHDRAPCTVLETHVFLPMKQELLTLRKELKSCQEQLQEVTK